MLKLAGQPEADKAAERIVGLETAVAAFHWDKVASRDKEKTYNLYTWDEALAQGPDLSGWLTALAPPDRLR
jgi:putative endopeptidase